MHNNFCLGCGRSLLRHIRRGELYWKCTDCRQEFPTSVVELEGSRVPIRGVLRHQALSSKEVVS